MTLDPLRTKLLPVQPSRRLCAAAALMACLTELFAAETVPANALATYWPAVLGIIGATAIVTVCIWAIRKSRRLTDNDHMLDWRSLAENIAEAVFLLKGDGTVLFVNRWGSDRDVVIGTPIENLLEESDRGRWNEFFCTRAENPTVCNTGTFAMRLPDGACAHWEIRLSPLANGPQDAELILCGRDVTDNLLKEATKDVLHKITFAAANMGSLEAFIKYIERQLSRVIDTSNFFLAIYNKESDSYTKFLSRDRSNDCKSDAKKLNLRGGLTDYVRRTGKPILMNAETREHLVAECDVCQIGDSAACWLGVPLRNRDEVLGVFVVQSYDNPKLYSNSDVELMSIVAGSIGRALERKSAQEELMRREEKLRLITERTPALLWSQDSNAQITYVTGAALGAVGLDSESLIGKTLCQVAQINDETIRTRIENSESGVPIQFNFKLSNRTFEAWIERADCGDEDLAAMTGVALDVTEGQRAGAELRRFFELSGDMFAVTDLNGVLIRCNEGYLNTIGYSSEERLNHSSLSLVHPDDAQLAAWAMKKITTGKPVTGIETRIVCKDGSVRWISWSSVLDTEDNLIYSSGKDITNRREIENALHEREEQLRLFVENSPASLAMFDCEMKYMIVSERWRKDYKLGNDDIIGKSHYDVFPEISNEWKEIHRRCLQGATERSLKDCFPRANGDIDWVRWEIKPWHKADGNIGGIMMFTEVITKAVQADLELSQSKNLARQIVESSLDAVIAIDDKGVVTEWNPQAEKTFGYLHREAIGKLLHDLILPERLAHLHVRGIEEYARTRKSTILKRLLQLPAVRKNGEEFTVELSICPIQVGGKSHFSAFVRDVSERLEREKELTESRARLKEAQRIAGLGFWEWAAATDQMYVSEEKLVLYDRPDLELPISFAQFLEIVHPDDRHLFLDSHASIQAGNPPGDIKYRIIRPSGEIRYAYSKCEIERDEQGRVTKLFGTTLDITERVLNEIRLRESEQRLAMAIEGSSDGFWDWNMVSGDCYYSPRIVEWLEYSHDEFRHHASFWEELIHPESLQAYRIALADHIQQRNDNYEIEEKLQTKTGGWIWVLSRGKVVQWDEDGSPLRAAGTWTNITDRKVMEARATQLGTILDNAMSEVYILEPHTMRILEVNRRAQINTGYTKEELGQMNFRDLNADRDCPSLHDFASPLLTGGAKVIQTKKVHIRKNHTTYPYESTTQIIEWNEKPALVSIGMDVSERLNSEQEYRKLQALIRHNQRLETIGTLAGGIAHDFNNILTPILGYADIAASDLEPDSPVRLDIEQVIQAAYRAKGLVQQILAFSRQDEQDRKPLRVETVVKETLRLLRAGVPPNIELSLDVEDVGYILSDPTLINQVLMNLCTNAYQAIGEGGGVIEVSLKREDLSNPDIVSKLQIPTGLYARIRVRDSGKGMDSSTMSRIFEPFFTTKNVGEGTGLGLSVVHGIVQSHGGAITVDSSVSYGSTISIFLPLLLTEDSVEATTSLEALHGTEHLLLCDDDEVILLLGKQMLETYGYQVTAVADPVTALALLAQADPPIAAIVVDDKMPVLSGHDVALSAHDFNPNIPVILLSAGMNTAESASCFVDVLSKPVGAVDLVNAVRQSINNSKREKL